MIGPIVGGSAVPLATQPAQIVAVSPNGRRTYAAAASFSLPASATTVAYLIGSGTQKVRLNRLQIGIVATAAAQGAVTVVKYSTAPTGGTATTLTNVPYSSGDAAATATVKCYTAVPAGVGTVVGTIKSFPYYIAAAASGAPQILDLDFSAYYPQKSQPILMSAAEAIGVALGGVTYSGGLMHAGWEWTEGSA